MTDILPNRVPLPQNRPSGLFTEYQPTTDFKMPLEGSRKAADAFLEGARYHPSFDPLKLTSELLMAFKRHIDKIGENMTEMLSQFYGKFDNFDVNHLNREDFLIFIVGIGLIALAVALIFNLVAWVVKKVCGN